MPDVHATLSASGSHRWLKCTPSAQLELRFPQRSSPFAEEGTVAHAVAELTTLYWLGRISEDTYENEMQPHRASRYYNAEMQEGTLAYAKFVTARYEEAKKSCTDPELNLETRLDFSKYVPGGFGTGDCVIASEPVLDVIDFKYGKGVRVDAENNSQMMLYALGALDLYDGLYDFKTVRLNIFQPRLSSEPCVWETSVTDLLTWAATVVVPAAKLASEGKGEFRPGEDTCRFCRAKEACRASAEQNLKAFDDGYDPLLLSPDEAGAILEKAKDIKAWLADLESLVTRTLSSGQQVQGWKMVEGRSNRKIIDTDRAAKALIASGCEEALLYERSFVSLTQLEKTFGKKNVAEILGDLITKPKGSPTLAPESDKRAPYNFEEQTINALCEGE